MTSPVTESWERKQAARRADFIRKLAASPAAQAARAFFATPGGKALMQHLEAEFYDGKLVGDSVEETYFNLGARELVKELRRLRDIHERTGDDATTP